MDRYLLNQYQYDVIMSTLQTLSCIAHENIQAEFVYPMTELLKMTQTGIMTITDKATGKVQQTEVYFMIPPQYFALVDLTETVIPHSNGIIMPYLINVFNLLRDAKLARPIQQRGNSR